MNTDFQVGLKVMNIKNTGIPAKPILWNLLEELESLSPGLESY